MDNVSEKEPLLASDQNETPPEKGKDKPRRVQRIITVEPVIILIGFCLTASIPLLEQYGYGKLAAEANVTIISIGESQCDFNESDPLYEAQQEIQAETSDFFVIISLLTSLPNIVVVPIFMFVSDRFGRKPILLFNLFVMLIGYAEWVTFVQTNQPLNMLFIGAATFGLLGSQTLLSICLAYYADSTDHTNRSFKMVIFEVCVSIASILSNLTTGFLIKYVDIIYPFLSFIVCASIAILYTLFLLPESLSNSARSKHERNCRNCLAPYKAAFTIFFKDNGTNRRWKIQIAAVVSAVVTANHIGLLVILPLYLLNSPLCFDSVAIGVVIVEIYVLRAVGSLAIPKLFKRLMDDTSFILLSLLSDICLFSIIGFLPYTTWVFFAPVPGLAGILSLGMTKGFASKLLGPCEQGAFFAGSQILNTTAFVLSTYVCNAVYKATLNFYHGTIFVILAAVTLMMFFLVIFLHVAVRNKSQNTQTREEPERFTSSYDSIHLSTDVLS